MNTVAKPTWRKLIPVIGGVSRDCMDARTLYALAVLVLLVQIPHVPNLPVWASLCGFAIIGARLLYLRYPGNSWLGPVTSPLVITLIAAGSALLIRWDYGYFIGRDPCVAFLFILVSAKFAELRRSNDATLLLCLCAFLLLTQYFYSQSLISALVSLPAVLALAYSLAVLRDAKNPDGLSTQLKLIGTLFLQGLPIAAVLFLAFPRLPGPLWSMPEDSMATTGLSDSMSLGTIGQLSQSAEVAFRVDFDGARPRTSDLYWRGPVMSEFDGRNWTVSKERYLATASYDGPPGDVLNYTVTLEPHRQRWLFALELATSLPVSYSAVAEPDAVNGSANSRYSRPLGRMFDDGQLIARDEVSQTLRYRTSSIIRSTLPVASAPRDNTFALPGNNPRTIAWAKELRSRATSDADFASKVMRHFNQEPFHYTLQPQLLGDAPVDEFLFDSREGFCEHYAAAFVVIMRAAGIASRVVTGYQGGEMNDDYMIVRQSDAHAWTEAYIDGAWRRFDPTSAVAPSRIDGGLSAALPDEAAVPRMARQTPGFLRDMQLRWDAINHQWQRLVIDFDNDSQASLWERFGISTPALWIIATILVFVTGLWSALILGMPRWGGKRLNAAERYWQKVTLMLQAKTFTRKPGESASEYLSRARQRWPAYDKPLARLDKAFTRLRFQPADNHEQQALIQQIKKDLRYLQLRIPFSRSKAAS